MQWKKLPITFLILSISFLGFKAYSVNKGAVIGTIVKLQGKVVRINKSLRKKEFLKSGSIIYEYDIIGSGEGSFVKILMRDDTVFQLGPKSKFVFEKFNFKSKKKRKAVYNLIIGKLRSLITNSAEDDDLKLITPNAAMAVRGTEILSDVYREGGEVKTDIAVISGLLEISTPKIGNLEPQKINLTPGFIFETKTAGKIHTKFDKKKTFILKKMTRGVLAALRNPHKRGGKIFLSDARNAYLKKR